MCILLKRLRESNITKFLKIVLTFSPIFITKSGIYQSYVTETGLHLGETGLVFPLSFFIGMFLFLYFIVVTLKNQKIYLGDYSNFKFIIFTFLFLGFFLSSIGVIINSDTSVYLRFLQFCTGYVGFFLFWYYFVYKKYEIIEVFGYIGLTYLLVIILNYGYSIMKIGLRSFGPDLIPSIGFFGIYQTHVYYPYIVTLICFMGLPYLHLKYQKLIIPYLSLFMVYVLCWQVRGAIFTFFIALIIAFFIYLNAKERIKYIILFTIVFIFLQIKLGNDFFIGRFADIDSISSFNGRTEIWLSIFHNINSFSFIVGNMFKDIDGISAHNQYLQFFDLGGILFLSPLIVLWGWFFFKWILLYIKYKNIKKPELLTAIYFLSIIMVNFLIDLNVNTPLNVTNPAIHYWFYWAGVVFFVGKVMKKVGGEKVEVYNSRSI